MGGKEQVERAGEKMYVSYIFDILGTRALGYMCRGPGTDEGLCDGNCYILSFIFFFALGLGVVVDSFRVNTQWIRTVIFDMFHQLCFKLMLMISQSCRLHYCLAQTQFPRIFTALLDSMSYWRMSAPTVMRLLK